MTGAPPRPVHVAIVEDLDEVRDGIALLIDHTEGFQCKQKYACMEDALKGIERRRPDILLRDIGLPGMSGLDGLRAAKSKHPDLNVVIVTVYKDNDRIFDAMCAGRVRIAENDSSGAADR